MSVAAATGEACVVRPRTIDEAVAALAHAGPTGMPHAGGTDLMVQIKEGRWKPGTLVDLALVDELHGIELRDDAVVIGAARPMADILADARLSSTFPALADAIRVVGSVQIRLRASLGGNIANASPAADTVPV
ncbi:MAG: FAD binding domain-containing protein, partial [Spirochaetota bacterium]